MKFQQIKRKQPKSLAKQVWQFDEHQRSDTPKRWYNQAARDSFPYEWPNDTFHGQAQGWEDHLVTRKKNKK